VCDIFDRLDKQSFGRKGESAMSSKDTTLFLRKATGLVRAWSVFDAFIYAFFSINLITLGLYSFSQMYYFEGGLRQRGVYHL
jgi:hypothetical protein